MSVVPLFPDFEDHLAEYFTMVKEYYTNITSSISQDQINNKSKEMRNYALENYKNNDVFYLYLDKLSDKLYQKHYEDPSLNYLQHIAKALTKILIDLKK
jgi:hypothetical protein